MQPSQRAECKEKSPNAPFRNNKLSYNLTVVPSHFRVPLRTNIFLAPGQADRQCYIIGSRMIKLRKLNRLLTRALTETPVKILSRLDCSPHNLKSPVDFALYVRTCAKANFSNSITVFAFRSTSTKSKAQLDKSLVLIK